MLTNIGLVCAGGYISGKEIMALELAGGLREIRWNINVVTSRWTNGELSRRLRALEICDHPMRLGYISATLRFDEIRMTLDQLVHVPGLYLDFRKFLREHAPQKIIHTNWHHILLLLPLLKSERDVFWVHEIMPNKSFYRKVFSTFSGRIGRFVAVSNAVRKSITDLGVQPEQVSVIHNGVAPFPIAERARDSAKVRVGIVGQIGEWKGHEDLIVAFADVVKKFPDCGLHIFGDSSSSFANHLHGLIRNLKLKDRVGWEGFEPDRSKIYSKIDICVVPSRSDDPLPTAAIEAAMAGLPCIATRKGGLPEIIEDTVTGFLVDARQPDQLAGALIKLLEDTDLRHGMGIAAYDLAHKRFTRERFVKQFADLLEK